MMGKDGYQFIKSLGLCVRCRKSTAMPGKTYCEVCAAEQAEQRLRKKEAMTSEEIQIKKQKDKIYRDRIRAERRSMGLCIYCGKQKARDHTLCIECNLKHRRSAQKSRERQRYQNGTEWKNGISRHEYPQYGICYKCCKNPVIEGKKLCADCMEKMPDPRNHNDAWKEYYKREDQLLFKRF